MPIPLRATHLAAAIAAASTLNADDSSPDHWMEQGRAALASAAALQPIEQPAKNIILFLGDGMGISTVTAARIFEGQRQGERGEENWLSFERLPYTALAKTYNTNLQTSDSAGTMSAIVTGAKTKAGFISVSARALRRDAASAEGEELFTILQKAEIAGKATGLVSTARVTHATPAACFAHSPERNWEADTDLPEGAQIKDIAAQLVEMPAYWAALGYPQVDGPEVVFGGGRREFFPAAPIDPAYTAEGGAGRRLDGRNLVQEWLDMRPDRVYVHNTETFAQLDTQPFDQVLGLFEGSHMQYEADRAGDEGGEPSLAEMTAKAIEILSRREEGFFLMVEGGRIDHAHHAGNAYRALMDTVAFSDAVRVAKEMTSDQDTLIVVTADHSHVFTIAGYPARGNNILGLVADGEGNPASDALGMPYTTLGYMNGPGYLGASERQPEGFKTFPHDPRNFAPATQGRPDLLLHFQGWQCEVECCDYTNFMQEAAVPMGSETHAGEDVGVWASGPYAHLLRGTIEQNVIFHLMDHAFGWDIEDPYAR